MPPALGGAREPAARGWCSGASRAAASRSASSLQQRQTPTRRGGAERGVLSRRSAARSSGRASAGSSSGRYAGRSAALSAGARRFARSADETASADGARSRRRSRRRWRRRSRSWTRCASREGGYLRADLEPGAPCSASSIERGRARGRAGAPRCEARLAERVRELRVEPLADEALVAQEIVQVRGRSDITEEMVRFRGPLTHWPALADVARAVRPQARLPASGDEPRGEHDRLEGRGAGACPR